jgi:hypothetical protein
MRQSDVEAAVFVTSRPAALLRANQRFRGQHGLNHEAAGAGVHHADRAQRQQRDSLNRVAQPGGIFYIVWRQWPDQRFM